MPTYPLTFPTGVFPKKVRVQRRTAAAVTESPDSFVQQVQQRPGKRWEIEVTMPTMPRDAAAAYTQFFYDLQGRVGTFTFNLTPHCPGLSPAPGTTTFRLADPDPGWDSDLSIEFDFSFRATEAP